MSEILLNAELRESTGKGYAKKVRREGKVPGVFYAQSEKPVAIELDERELMKVLTAETGLIDIKVGGKRKRKAIVKEAQTDPVKQTLVHVDVMGVKLKEKITVSVPLNFIGEAVGVKDQGGMLHQYLREVEVSCLPLDIPENIEVDVTDLSIGDSITLSSLKIENVTFTQDPEQSLVSVMAPAIVKEEEAEAELEGEEGEEEAEQEEEN